MAKLTIDAERCKGCGLCTDVCAKKIIVLDTSVLNSKGICITEVAQGHSLALAILTADDIVLVYLCKTWLVLTNATWL